MKKIGCISLVLFILFSFFSVSGSAEGGVIGHIYSSDILAYVNQKPIPSYNIGGRTVVVAEDLDGYGFDVEYNEKLRMLSVYSEFSQGEIQPEPIARGQVGEILGNVYATDIKTYYNGIWVPSYNIGGRTVICLEDLGELTDSPNASYGYSVYLGKALWDEENRIISYTSFYDNANSIAGVPGISLSVRDNVISCTPCADNTDIQTEILRGDAYFPGAGISAYHLHPLYFDDHGEQIAVGYTAKHPCHTGGYALMYLENPEEVIKMIETYLPN